MARPDATRDLQPPRRRRRWWLVIVVLLVLLAALWGAYWYASNQIVTAALGKAAESFAAHGRTISCERGSVGGGSPLSLGLECEAPRFADQQGLTATLAHISANAPLYWPGSVRSTLTGPFLVEAPLPGLSLQADWTTGLAGIEAGLGGLNRADAAFEGLAVAARQVGADLPVTNLQATRADMSAGPADSNSFRVTADGTDLVVTLADGRTLPAFNGALDATAINFGATLGTDPRSKIAAWLAKGDGLRLNKLSVAVGETSATTSGVAVVGPDGLVSADLTVRLTGLSGLPAVAEGFKPGSGRQAAQVVAAVGALGKPVPGQPGARDVPLTIRNGTVSIGFIPLGQIPPIRF